MSWMIFLCPQSSIPKNTSISCLFNFLSYHNIVDLTQWINCTMPSSICCMWIKSSLVNVRSRLSFSSLSSLLSNLFVSSELERFYIKCSSSFSACSFSKALVASASRFLRFSAINWLSCDKRCWIMTSAFCGLLLKMFRCYDVCSIEPIVRQVVVNF